MARTYKSVTFQKVCLQNTWDCGLLDALIRKWRDIKKSLNFENVIYEWPQQADPREKKREDQAWHQFRKCDFPVFPEKMEIVRGPNDGKKKKRC